MQQNKPFPTSALPPVIRQYVEEASASIGCDPSVIFLPLLAILARIIGNKRVIRLGRDWREPAIVWGAVIGKTSAKKTAGKKALAEMLKKLRAELREDGRNVLFFVSGSSFPGLRNQLSEHGCLLVMPDELVVLFSNLGKGGKANEYRGYWMQTWAAEDLVLTYSGKTYEIHRAAVSIVGGIQPIAFKDAILDEGSMRDGMCARFLLAYPDKNQAKSDHPISSEAKRNLYAVFRQLANLPVDSLSGGPQQVWLHRDTIPIWKQFCKDHKAESKKLDEELQAAYAKLEAYTARIALIFELVKAASNDNDDEPVSTETMQQAIRLTAWFKSQVHRVYAMLSETSEDVRRNELMDLIHNNGGSITVRDLGRNSSKYKNPVKAELALRDLVNTNLATVRIVKAAKGGRAVEHFDVITTSKKPVPTRKAKRPK